jgi:hypothetical protein
MSYQSSWTQQDGQGHVNAGDWIAADDVNELQSAANRRLKLMFDPADSWPADFAVSSGDAISAAPLPAARQAFEQAVPTAALFQHSGGWWQLNALSHWLYPEPGGDENKRIRRTDSPAADEVSFFEKLNGETGWSGAIATGDRPTAATVNELRDAARLLRRGRIVLRVGDGGDVKASRPPPGGLWLPPAVARDGGDAMHAWFGGREWLWPGDVAGGHLGPRGASVTVLDSSRFRIKPEGADRKVSLYHCRRNVNTANFSWTQWDGSAGAVWSAPGGSGGEDATHLADIELIDQTWREHSDATLIALLQQMADGSAEPTFMLAPDEETGWGDDPTHVAIELYLDFELNGPPV